MGIYSVLRHFISALSKKTLSDIAEQCFMHFVDTGYRLIFPRLLGRHFNAPCLLSAR